MLGTCLLRNPSTKENKLDKGLLCESLLFFNKAHLLIDMATLSVMAQADFLDVLALLLKEGYLTANYSPQAAVLHSNTTNGISEHFFTIVRFGGDQSKPNMRNPELFAKQLERIYGDKGKARKHFRLLADLISFNDLDDHNVPTLGRKDICDPYIAREVARASLLNQGIPNAEINFSRIDVLPLDGFKFGIATDIDFNHLRQFVPEPNRAAFGISNLFPAIADARFDVGLAAKYNAAFVGSENNEGITSMLLQRSFGAPFNANSSKRDIYDFISVAVPSVREVINNGERSPAEFVKLMQKADSFRNWLREQNPDADLIAEMLREKAKTAWLETLPAKTMRFGLFTGAGMLADYFAPGTSAITGAADNFLIDRIGKGWRPHYFVENHLRSFLDH